MCKGAEDMRPGADNVAYTRVEKFISNMELEL